MLFPVGEVLLWAAVAGMLASAALVLWPWSRHGGRFLAAGLATSAGFMAWNFVLNATNGRNFDVDAKFTGLSWADAGSGVLAFTATALALGVLARREPAGRVVGAAAVAGVIAVALDLFVL